jgi:hypothetical protein
MVNWISMFCSLVLGASKPTGQSRYTCGPSPTKLQSWCSAEGEGDVPSKASRNLRTHLICRQRSRYDAVKHGHPARRNLTPVQQPLLVLGRR